MTWIAVEQHLAHLGRLQPRPHLVEGSGQPLRLGGIDVGARYGRQEFTRDGWDQVVDINLNSVMDCARAFHAGLAETRGAIMVRRSSTSRGRCFVLPSW